MLIITFIILILLSLTIYSKTIKIKDYIKGKFPQDYEIYLSSLEELDQSEKEFLDLLEKVSPQKQEYFAQKVYNQGFTINLLEELQSICPNISYGEQYHFRKTKWGMTIEEIMEEEKPKKNLEYKMIKKTDYDTLLYKGYIAGFSSNILYTIREGKLTNVQCTILDIKEGREYFEKFDIIKEFLTETYGKPIKEVYKIDDKYKDNLEEIISVLKKNFFAYYTTWETPETKIILSLHRLPTGVILNNQYISKDLQKRAD